jgi:hypothetical protein
MGFRWTAQRFGFVPLQSRKPRRVISAHRGAPHDARIAPKQSVLPPAFCVASREVRVDMPRGSPPTRACRICRGLLFPRSVRYSVNAVVLLHINVFPSD